MAEEEKVPFQTALTNLLMIVKIRNRDKSWSDATENIFNKYTQDALNRNSYLITGTDRYYISTIDEKHLRNLAETFDTPYANIDELLLPFFTTENSLIILDNLIGLLEAYKMNPIYYVKMRDKITKQPALQLTQLTSHQSRHRTSSEGPIPPVTSNIMDNLNSPYPATRDSGALRLKLRKLKRQFLAMKKFDWTHLITQFKSPQRNLNTTFDKQLEFHITNVYLDDATNDMISLINNDTSDSIIQDLLSTLFEDDFKEIKSVQAIFKQDLLKKILGESGYPEELAIPVKFTLVPSTNKEQQRAQLLNDILLEDTITTSGANDTYTQLKGYADKNSGYAKRFKDQYGMNFSNLPVPQKGSWLTDWRSKMISAIDEKAVNPLVTKLYGAEYLPKNIDRRAKTRKNRGKYPIDKLYPLDESEYKTELKKYITELNKFNPLGDRFGGARRKSTKARKVTKSKKSRRRVRK